MAKSNKTEILQPLIKIKRRENDQTHFIGTFDDGRQFMAFEVFFHSLPIQSDWQKKRKEFVVMHIFNSEGVHQSSKHKYLGTTADLDGKDLKEDIENLFTGLGKGKFTDIAIKPFSIRIEGYEYGLMQDNENLCFNLVPNDISFSEPWDGDYE